MKKKIRTKKKERERKHYANQIIFQDLIFYANIFSVEIDSFVLFLIQFFFHVDNNKQHKDFDKQLGTYSRHEISKLR